MFTLLRILKGFFGLLSVLLGFAIYGFLHDLGGIVFVLNRWDKFVETGLFSTWLSYIFIALISSGLFYGFHVLINKLHYKKYGTLHPKLTKLWNL